MTLTDRLKRGIQYARSQDMSVQQIVMRPDARNQLNKETTRIRPDHFLGIEITVTTRTDAPEWQLRMWHEWEDSRGDRRIYFDANDLPEGLEASRQQREMQASPGFGEWA